MISLRHLLEETLGTAAGTVVGIVSADLLKEAITANVTESGTHALHQLDEESRPAVMAVIAMLPPECSAIFYERLRDAHDRSIPRADGIVIKALGRYLPRDDDGKVDQGEALERYKRVAALSENDFAVLVNALTHDSIAWAIQNAWRQLAAPAGVLATFLSSSDKLATDLAAQINKVRDKRRKRWIP